MLDTVSRAFGNGWNHPYDILPTGSRNPYTFVNLIMPDGDTIHYDRISEGTGYADAVYEHTATTTPFLHSEFRWNGRGWDLRFPDGGLFQFPENYSGPLPHHGAPTLMQDGRGHAIQFRRDADRNLEQLTSPSGHFIRLEHDSNSRVTSATDDRGRSVRYAYDAHGRLSTVTGGDRAVRYSYVGADLIAIETVGSQNGTNRPLLRVRYGAGRVSDLEFVDGRSYHFTFSVPDGSMTATEAVVTAPDGTQTKVAPGP
jgi:YD repeat-containing protein